jgi:hypothetical protein
MSKTEIKMVKVNCTNRKTVKSVGVSLKISNLNANNDSIFEVPQSIEVQCSELCPYPSNANTLLIFLIVWQRSGSQVAIFG